MNTSIKVTANQSKRTFTIRKDGSKYRTYPVSRIEFEEMEDYTESDWRNYLRTSQNYFLVK